MDGLDLYVSVLRKLSLRRKSGLLARCVVRQAVERNAPPNFLYASTRAGRYNPAKIECIYWSEDETVAQLEYRRYHEGADTYETFFCRFKVNVVDLGDSAVLSMLGLNDSDLRVGWRTAGSSIKTQLLGHAVSLQQRFAAIRFPSDAARSAGRSGFNYVVFKSSLRSPYFIEVVTDPGLAVQRWP